MDHRNSVKSQCLHYIYLCYILPNQKEILPIIYFLLNILPFFQEFLVSYILIKMAISPRPGAWVLERSTDFGKTWSAWQYFAETASECWSLYRLPASDIPKQDNEAICTTKFSQVVPLEHGEVNTVIHLLIDLCIHFTCFTNVFGMVNSSYCQYRQLLKVPTCNECLAWDSGLIYI